jgi:hypothetical protein
MPKRVYAMYADERDAQGAVLELRNAGFAADEISVVRRQPDRAAPEERAESMGPAYEESTSKQSTGAGAGAVAGGLAGAGITLTLLALPGAGPVLAAGWLLAGGAIGATLGAAAGGLVGALADQGVPMAEAERFAAGVDEGQILVAVLTDEDRAEDARVIMERFGPSH